MLKDYLLCYDIAHPKRLYKTRKIAYALSLGGQKSALHVLLTHSETLRALSSFKKVIKEKEDKINIIEVHPQPVMLGRGLNICYEEGAIIL